MAGWRRNTGDIHVQDHQRTRSLNRKPPSGNWQRTVPSWEKKFCSSVGSMSWGWFLDAKKYVHLHNNVVEWNDSAGEEAFFNAKNRFYAEINGLPCDISLPDPDKYIDEVDWDSAVDPDLISDLDRGIFADVDAGDGKVIFGNVMMEQTFGCTGWGDAEEAFKIPNDDEMKNSWEQSPPKNILPNKAGWNDDNNWNESHWNDYGRNDNDNWNHHHKREAGGGFESRNKVSRFHGNGNRGWRSNGRGMRRDNFAYQRSSWIRTH